MRKEKTMTAKEFFFKVANLRYYQKEYFATRSREALKQAKVIEKEIDEEITRVNKILNERGKPTADQRNLFNIDT